MHKYLFVVLAALLAGCDPPKQTLNIFTFPDYIDPKVVADFERQFDCKVVFDFFENGDAVMAKLAAGGTSLYDIVVLGSDVVPSFSSLGFLAPLRHENVPNLKNVDPQFANRAFDPGNRFSAPYSWFTVGLYVRKPKDGPLEESWSLIFDPAKQRGPFVLIDEMRSCLGAALRSKGHSLNSTDPRELAEARDVLLEAKKRSLGFQVGTGSRNRVLTRSAAVAMAWSGGVSSDEKQDPETRFFVPREGSFIGLDTLCIPAKAPHHDLAEQFINYLLDAKVGAQNTTFLRAATPNKAALEFIAPELRTNSAIYPPPEVMRRLEYPRDLGEKNKLYDELWTQIKSK